MGVLDEHELQFVKLSDRLKALKENVNNANKWQAKEASENLPEECVFSSLKERRKVFAAATNVATTNYENKGANFALLHQQKLTPNRRNQTSNQQQQIKPFQTVKLAKRPALEHQQHVDKSSALSPNNRFIDKSTLNDAQKHHDEVESDVCSQQHNVLKSRESNQVEMANENIENEQKPSYLLTTTKHSVSRPGRRLPTRYQNAATNVVDSKPSVSLNSELHLETEDKENQEQPIHLKHSKLRVSSAVPFQAPVIGKEHCGVQLRHVDRKSPFPDPMLIRACCVGKQIDLRLVKPAKSSVTEQNAYLLVTAKKLIIRNGKDATVQERAKIAQLAHEVISGKEMFGYSGKPELANEDGLAEASFWRHLDEESEEKSQDEDLQQLYSKSFNFYKIDSSGEAIRIEYDAVSSSVLDSTQVLILDFGSEIYTWLGRQCNRSLNKFATEFADKLKSSPFLFEIGRFVGAREEKRPSWILCRRLSEGIADSLFRHKFSIDSVVPKPLAQGVSKSAIKLPSTTFLKHKPTSAVSKDHQLKDENTLARELSSKFAQFTPSKDCFMELEDTEIRPLDPNVYTEQLNFFVLSGEKLEALSEQPKEFDCRKCYVFEWRYRVEKTVRKLNHQDEGKKHDTGRERGVYFYWLGQESTIKEQSFCALALRNQDRERLEHIRFEQGKEHPLFISLFNEHGFIVSGTETNTFLIHSYNHDNNILSMVEMHGKTGRNQTVMAKIVNNELHCQKGKHCSQNLWENAQKLSAKLAKNRQLELKCSETMEFECLDIDSWSEPPRFYRVYELEGEVLFTNRSYHTFPAQQSDLGNGCTFVETQDSIYLWTDSVVSTYALKVANNFWSVERKKDANTNATVICKGSEPLEFMALFPEWKEDPESEPKSLESLSNLLNERTRFRTLNEVRERKLPEGCNLTHLEQYLNDEDFESVFQMSKEEFANKPLWKQAALKKSANLF